jgi:hypothetical protein
VIYKDQKDLDQDEDNREDVRFNSAFFTHDENAKCDETGYVKRPK